MELLQFREEGFVSHASRLPDAEYGRVLDDIVVTCVDCVVAYGEQMLLGLRRQEPYKGGWWVPGGRMHPGERFEETAQRVLRRELGLKVIADRFDYISTTSYIWSRREQPPADHGCHMIGVNLVLRISLKESQQITHGEDYQTSRWANLREVFTNNHYHPVIRRFAGFLLQGP